VSLSPFDSRAAPKFPQPKLAKLKGVCDALTKVESNNYFMQVYLVNRTVKA